MDVIEGTALTRRYTQIEVAAILRTTRWTVARLTAAGQLTSTAGGITASTLKDLIRRSIRPRHTEAAMGQEQGTLPKFFTLREVADETGLSLRSLQDGARSNRFQHHHFGGKRLMTREQVDALAAGTLRGSATEPPPGDLERELEARRAARRRGGRRKAA